ncbi:MAG: Bug family tripartite tricarboxylate transporter substrate binding protein [Burkholderiales bacterium]
MIRKLLCCARGAGIVAVALVAALSAPNALGQNYPGKQVRLISPFPAGGGNDAYARIIAPRLADYLGQPIVIENRGGAAGIIGADIAAKSPADCYTLLFGQAGNLAINVHLMSKLPYDPLRDFAPITLAVSAPSVLQVHVSVPVRSVKELIALAKTQPGALNYASSGSGSTAHLQTEMLKKEAGIRMVHIPYKGGAPAFNALLAGEVALYMTSPGNALAGMKAKKIRPLAMTGLSPLPLLPGVPTFSQLGYPQFDVNAYWAGLLAPAGVPPAIIARVHTEAVKALQSEEVKERIAAHGAMVVTTSPQQFAELIKSEISRWGSVIREVGVKAE